MMNAPRDTTRRPSPALNIAATVMLVLLLVLLAWRITFQGSLWCDEIYTIVLVHHPVDVLIDKTTVDAHPPTYYLMLKAWNRIGRLIGIDPGIGWGRTPGLALWLVLAGVAWWVGRRVPGRAYAGLLALAVACGAQLAWGVSNMRSYATAAPAAGICILLMLHLSTGKGRRAALRRTWPLWTGYALAAALLLWSHLLGAYLLLPLGLWWLGLAGWTLHVAGLRGLRSPFVLGGAAAQSVALLLFLPWLVQLDQQFGSIAGGRRDWMTAPDLLNFFKVFALWHAWGNPGGELPSPDAWTWQAAAGLLSPMAAALLFLAPSPRHVERDLPLLTAFGLWVAFGNVLGLWLTDRLDIQHIFHGPRYTIFSQPAWATALVGLCVWSTRRRGWPAWTAGLLMLPYVAANLTGTLWETREGRFSFHSRLATREANLPPPGGTVYITPSEMIPYVDRTLAGFDLRPVEDLLREPAGAAGVRVMELNQWSLIRHERDLVLAALLDAGKLADTSSSSVFPPYHPPWEFYTTWQLDGLSSETLTLLRESGFHARRPAVPEGAIAAADAYSLRHTEGWHSLEVGPELETWRWSARDRARIPLRTTLDPGRYTVRIAGLRQPHPHENEMLSLWFEGHEEGRAGVLLTPGWFDVRLDLELTKRLDDAAIILEHPTFQLPGDTTADPRFLGVMFHQLVVERSEGA